jgi:VanZ family protein
LYGITDEIHQYYVPGRVASIGDIAADCIGAFLGSCLTAVTMVNKDLKKVRKSKWLSFIDKLLKALLK